MDRKHSRWTQDRSQEGGAATARLGPVCLLILIAAIWGATFPLVRDGVARVATLPFLQLRFLIAAGFLVPAALARGGLPKLLHPRCIAPGLLLAAGYFLQTEGLRTTGPSVSAFLTGTSVVIVPVIGTTLRWEKGRAGRWGAALLALSGIFLLQGARLPDRWSLGETATVFCAVAFAGQILLVGRSAPRAGDPLCFAAGQILVAAIGLLAAGVVRGELLTSTRIPPEATYAALFTGVAATAFAFFAQTWAQRRVSPSSVAICFASEPVFAAVVSVLLYEDRLPPVAWVGALCIMAAMSIAALEPVGRVGVRPGRR